MSKATPIQVLVDEYLEIVHSLRNQTNYLKWDTSFPWERDNWRALPKQSFCIVMDPARVFFTEILDVNLIEYYRDPTAYTRDWLRMRIFRFNNFDDDTYYPPEFSPWWGIVTEASLFEIPIEYRAKKDPILRDPPLEDKNRLDTLTVPNFYRSGLMPRIRQYVEVAHEHFGDSIQVLFPTWARGPLSTAISLRGMQNLLLDMIDDPEFVHRLMRFVTDSRKAWLLERARYLGQPLRPGLLFNDEIGTPVLSPALYREFVLPYEQELARFHGGVYYWHSCGNTTAFMPDIRTLPGLQLFHVSPTTDLGQAVQVMPPDVALDICVQDTRDVYDATERQMQDRLEEIAQLAAGRRYYVRADEFAVINTPEGDLNQMKLWVTVARRVSDSVHAAA